MRSLYDKTSIIISKRVTMAYSTSFSLAVKLLAPNIRSAIHAIYGFVRFADEIVDTFHEQDKQQLLTQFEQEYYQSVRTGLSMNPIIHAFQLTVKEYDIDDHLVQAFLTSMKMDLHKSTYDTVSEYESYIYGSADVVGLMCLKIFVNGDAEAYDLLEDSAMSLGSAFQKVNFIRDLKDDTMTLDRSYFPHIDGDVLTPENKAQIIAEIEDDFAKAFIGIKQLPKSSRFGVYTAYVYYKKLLKKIKSTPAKDIQQQRIRVNDATKIGLLMRSYVKVQFNML